MISEAGESPRQQAYQLMFRNVRRLTNLINELMNFKKVADGAIRLRVEELSLADLCENLHSDFKSLADGKSIDLTFINRPVTSYFDRQIVEKILINLLYNALKYTGPGGSVRLEIIDDKKQFSPSFAHEFVINNTCYTAGAYVYLLIRDTGIGITQASISNIFDRYYRVSNEHIGSGVGLALVKSLTLLHKGTISIYSERNKGTEILIGLPLGLDNYTVEERAVRQDPAFRPQLEPTVEPIDTSVVLLHAKDNGQSNEHAGKSILIVEDNVELCNFLSATLGRSYTVFTAGNGRTGLAAAIEKLPDLIISDVMMPELNGIELCREIKSMFETSHIPFLILSARDALESQIAGMESGADYYLAKPVSVELLLLVVKNVFDHRDRLRAKYTKDYLTEATELAHTNKDKAFIQDLLDLIETNLQEPELDIDFLCEKLFTSRTQLYLKIKGITGQSTGEFIKTVRLKKAIHIMTHEDVPLSEVAERIGLQSASYFSRVFKKEYGKSPSEFMQSIKGASPEENKG
jgi:DNA-binding response OmpR family regulator/two-component sensor histidine kinase